MNHSTISCKEPSDVPLQPFLPYVSSFSLLLFKASHQQRHNLHRVTVLPLRASEVRVLQPLPTVCLRHPRPHLRQGQNLKLSLRKALRRVKETQNQVYTDGKSLLLVYPLPPPPFNCHSGSDFRLLSVITCTLFRQMYTLCCFATHFFYYKTALSCSQFVLLIFFLRFTTRFTEVEKKQKGPFTFPISI